MKKLIALLMVCGFAFAFVACGGGSKEEAKSEDSVATETPAVTPADTTVTDTTATDTTAAK
jgi:hypothetical protein